MTVDAIGIVFSVGFVIFFVVMFVVVIGVAARKKASAKPSQTKPNAERPAETHLYLEMLRRKKAQEAAKHAAHVADAHAHEHKGSEEHYEEIVGSLGEVKDEGCADLDGVRFIAHDVAYDNVENERRDYSDVVQAMVIGEILNEPRFKSPYHRTFRR